MVGLLGYIDIFSSFPSLLSPSIIFNVSIVEKGYSLVFPPLICLVLMKDYVGSQIDVDYSGDCSFFARDD